MIDLLDEIIGTSYAENPMGYLFCFLLICWFLMNLFNFLYYLCFGKH